MSIRKLALMTAVAALGHMALGSASASATTVLRLDPGNTTFTGVTAITNTTADSAVLVTNLGTYTCNATTFVADVNTHSAAVTITGKLTTLTFTSCSDTVAPINITSCHLAPGTVPTVTITATGSGGVTVQIHDPTVRCVIQGSANACYYIFTNASGTLVNNSTFPTTNKITFTNIGVDNVSVGTDSLISGLCGATATFSTTWTHIVQSGTNKTVTVTTS